MLCIHHTPLGSELKDLPGEVAAKQATPILINYLGY
jgi:hypothetical protein